MYLNESFGIIDCPENLIGKTIVKVSHSCNNVHLLLKDDSGIFVASFEGGSFYDSDYIKFDNNPISLEVMVELGLIPTEEMERIYKEEAKRDEVIRIAHMKQQYEHLKDVLGGLGIV